MGSFKLDNSLDTETRILILATIALVLLWAGWFIYVVIFARPVVQPPDFNIAVTLVSIFW